MKVKSLSNKGSIIILFLLMILTTSLFSQNRSVELSSFSAQLNVGNVELFWVTESETNNLGWNIYRAEIDDICASIVINSELISGAGTTTEQTEYEFIDNSDLIPGYTYFYWLESRDFSGESELFGSINITVPSCVQLIWFTAQYVFPNRIHVVWLTASENNLLFFQIYRNDIFIHQRYATNSDEITEYLFVDTEVESGETYVYDLEAVQMDGSSIFIGSTTINTGYLVELSSFWVVFENNTLTLYWVTQSETNNLGWNIYRSETNVFNEAIQVNPSLIPGQGTTTEPTEYEFIDGYEVDIGCTYFYWLECISFNGETEIYGPISITIPQTGIEENILTNHENQLYQNYPNPFRNNTEISFSLNNNIKEAKLTIFNIKGQKVKQFSIDDRVRLLTDGRSSIEWNGRDESGKPVAAGIYFYRLQTDDFSAMKKMILLR